MPVSLSFPSTWVPGSPFILASCLIGKEATSSILLDQWSYIVIWVVYSNYPTQTNRIRKRQRNVIWYTPLFSKNVPLYIAQEIKLSPLQD